MKKLVLSVICSLIVTCPVFAKEKPQEAPEKEPTKVISGAIEENAFLSLENCLKLALNYNPLIKAAVKNTDIYKSRIGQAKAAYFPVFSVSSGYDRSNSIINSDSSPTALDNNVDNYVLGNISLNQLIFDFGKTSAQVGMRKSTYKASEAELKKTINNIMFSVKKAYFDLLLAQDRQYVMEEAVDQYSKLLQQAKAFYEVGSRSKIEVTSAQSHLSGSKLSLIKAENAAKIAVENLNNKMGLPNSPSYTLSESLKFNQKDLNSKELVDLAFKNRPEIKSSRFKLAAAKDQLKLAKRVFLPDIKARGQFAIGGTDFTDDEAWAAGINLQFPTTNAYLTKKAIDEAVATKGFEEANFENTQNTVLLETKQAFLRYIEAQESISVAKDALKQAEENFELAKGRYKVGVGNSIELKDAEITHRNAKFNHLQSLYDYNVSLANIEKIVGQNL